MPGLDQTGPRGAGAMSGRRRGYCVDGTNGYTGRQRGRGGGRGLGCGRGWGGAARVVVSEGPMPTKSDDELADLKAQAAYLEKTLANVQSRIRECEAPPHQP